MVSRYVDFSECLLTAYQPFNQMHQSHFGLLGGILRHVYDFKALHPTEECSHKLHSFVSEVVFSCIEFYKLQLFVSLRRFKQHFTAFISQTTITDIQHLQGTINRHKILACPDSINTQIVVLEAKPPNPKVGCTLQPHLSRNTKISPLCHVDGITPHINIDETFHFWNNLFSKILV